MLPSEWFGVFLVERGASVECAGGALKKRSEVRRSCASGCLRLALGAVDVPFCIALSGSTPY